MLDLKGLSTPPPDYEVTKPDSMPLVIGPKLQD